MVQIIKQPNGLYCGFSGAIDNVIYYNATKEEMIEQMVNETKERITERVNKVVEQLEEGKKPYDQFTLSYNDMLQTIEEINGKKEKNIVKKLIENDN